MRQETQNILLFTKSGCKKCTYIKEKFDLKKLGVIEQKLTHEPTPEGREALSLLAWHECVQLAETTMPILVLDDGEVVSGAIKIKNKLEDMV